MYFKNYISKINSLIYKSPAKVNNLFLYELHEYKIFVYILEVNEIIYIISYKFYKLFFVPLVIEVVVPKYRVSALINN
jgi:hypothetical protein